MSNQKIGYGFVSDTDPSLQSKSGGKFGLNTNVHLVKFELNPNAGANNTVGDALDIEFKVEEKEFKSRIYPVTKVYDNKNVEITDVNSEAYIDGFNKEVKQKNAVIIHVLKAIGVTEEQIKAQFAVPVESFAQFITGLITLIPADTRGRKLDLFLEYQWEITEGQERTYLQVPKKMIGGYFVCPAQTGTWKEVITEGKLTYVNETNNVHPFTRTKDFMESNKAKLQELGKTDSNTTLATAAGLTGQPTGQAQTGTW